MGGSNRAAQVHVRWPGSANEVLHAHGGQGRNAASNGFNPLQEPGQIIGHMVHVRGWLKPARMVFCTG